MAEAERAGDVQTDMEKELTCSVSVRCWGGGGGGVAEVAAVSKEAALLYAPSV